MNLSQLRAQTRTKLGNPTTTTIANSAIDLELNNGYYSVVRKLASINEDFFEEQKDTFNLIINSGLYSLPLDCIKVKQLRLAYTTPSTDADYKIARNYDPTQVNDIQIEEINATVTNPIIDITNNYYRIYPKPTANSTKGGQLYYIARPSALTLTADTPVLPIDLHPLLSDYAAKELAAAFGMTDSWKIYSNNFEVGTMSMKKDYAGREINANNRVRNPLETTRNDNRTRELY